MATRFLSEPTRKIRKVLLTLSVLGILVGHYELKLSKIGTLTIENYDKIKDALPLIGTIIIIYYLVYFTFHAYRDFHDQAESTTTDLPVADIVINVLDYIFPILVGIVAIYFL